MFDVKKHLIKVSGNRLYLPVSARLVWFRQEHPDWGIETKPVVIDTDKQYAIFEASVYNTEGKLMAKGTKMENIQGFPDYIEKSETGAIGRALAVCGFGTQFAPDLEELSRGRAVDSPIPEDANRFGRNGNSYRDGVPAAGAQSTETPFVKDTGAEGAEKDEVAADHACSVCGRSLTKGQELLSVRKYGVGLCPDCQKERRATESTVEAAV
jgi:hypothetical protein